MTRPPLHPDVIEFLDDLSLLEAYQQIAAEAGGSVPEELVAEIERRNLDI
jgi:hypothetical protein